jgi:hypothetical protein
MKRTVLFGLLAVLVASFIAAYPARAQDSGSLYTIFNNFEGKRLPKCYDLTEGWLVGHGWSVAMPFTPRASVRLTEVDVVLAHCEYGCGTDGGTVSVNEDNNGLPGNSIHTWRFEKFGLSDWYRCPDVTKARSKGGIQLKKGTQYWIVASAPDAATNGWNWTYDEEKGNYAYQENNAGWTPAYNQLSTFGAFGRKE